MIVGFLCGVKLYVICFGVLVAVLTKSIQVIWAPHCQSDLGQILNK